MRSGEEVLPVCNSGLMPRRKMDGGCRSKEKCGVALVVLSVIFSSPLVSLLKRSQLFMFV
jgi:hypothetical protein